MSTIDKEKDDLATQQMVEMMQSSDQNTTEQSDDDFDVDSLLDSINDIEIESEPESSRQIDDLEGIDNNDTDNITANEDELSGEMQAMAEAFSPENKDKNTLQDSHLDDTQVDQLTDVDELAMNNKETNQTSATTEESPRVEPESDMTNLDELQSVDELLIDETPQSKAPTEIEEITPEDEPDTEIGQPSNAFDNELQHETAVADSTEALDTHSELNAPKEHPSQEETASTQTSNPEDKSGNHEREPDMDKASPTEEDDPQMTSEKRKLLQLVDETNQSVDTMSESIELEKQSHDIIDQLSTTAQMTTKVALSTAQKAQSSTENAQQAIEKTFAAIERARQITQEAKYQIDMQTLKEYDNVQLDAVLNQVKQRNQELQKTNNELAERIAKLYQS